MLSVHELERRLGAWYCRSHFNFPGVSKTAILGASYSAYLLPVNHINRPRACKAWPSLFDFFRFSTFSGLPTFLLLMSLGKVWVPVARLLRFHPFGRRALRCLAFFRFSSRFHPHLTPGFFRPEKTQRLQFSLVPVRFSLSFPSLSFLSSPSGSFWSFHPSCSLLFLFVCSRRCAPTLRRA